MARGFGKRSNTVKRFFLLMGKRYPTIPPFLRQKYFPPRGGGTPLAEKTCQTAFGFSLISTSNLSRLNVLAWIIWNRFYRSFMVALHSSWWGPSWVQDGSSEKVMCQHSAATYNTSEERPDYTKAHIPTKSNNSRGIVVTTFYRQVEKKYLSRYIIIWKSRLHFRHPSSFRWWQHVLSRGFLATSAISVAASAAYAPSWCKHSRSRF